MLLCHRRTPREVGSWPRPLGKGPPGNWSRSPLRQAVTTAKPSRTVLTSAPVPVLPHRPQAGGSAHQAWPDWPTSIMRSPVVTGRPNQSSGSPKPPRLRARQSHQCAPVASAWPTRLVFVGTPSAARDRLYSGSCQTPLGGCLQLRIGHGDRFWATSSRLRNVVSSSENKGWPTCTAWLGRT